MTTVAIIQARMGSSRLPGKVLADLAGEPVLHHVVSRARRARLLDRVVVATTTLPADDAVERFCADAGIDCFRGSADDVLDRYHGAAAVYDADVVVRLTADCPLLDPGVVDEIVQAYLDGEVDYAANVLEPTYPDGLDVEVFSREALDVAWREARLGSEREHVTPYLRSHPERFRLRSVRAEGGDWSALRWTVDEPRDLELVRALLARAGDANAGWRELLRLVEADPELTAINSGITRNQGYLKSLREDQISPPPEGT